MYPRLCSLLAVFGVALLLCSPAAAQTNNLDTIEGPNAGEQTTLTRIPREVSENISIRAMGIEGPNYTRWGLTLIGAAPDDSITLSMGNEELPIKEVDRPGEGEVGPVTVIVSEETFLTIAETEGVKLQVGDATLSFPEELRQDMQLIFDRVT